jgi:hypothetical protein
MEISEENIIALEILKKTIDTNPEIPYKLIELIYKTEMEHQFDQDHSYSRNEVLKIIENYLDAVKVGDQNANT